MSHLKSILRLTSISLLIFSLSSCQPIGAGDPLDQDAFVTESAPVIPVNR